mgnify:CR=1 FL=1
MILGLPGETREEILVHAKIISRLPVKMLKLHQLQLIKGTALAKQYGQSPENFKLFSADEYVKLVVEFLKNLNPSIIVERFISEAPPDLLIAPKWGRLKNFEIVHRIESMLLHTNSWQGMNFSG